MGHDVCLTLGLLYVGSIVDSVLLRMNIKIRNLVVPGYVPAQVPISRLGSSCFLTRGMK